MGADAAVAGGVVAGVAAAAAAAAAALRLDRRTSATMRRTPSVRAVKPTAIPTPMPIALFLLDWGELVGDDVLLWVAVVDGGYRLASVVGSAPA